MRDKILAYVRSHPSCTAVDIADAIKRSRSAVTNNVRELLREGKLVKKGSSRARKLFIGKTKDRKNRRRLRRRGLGAGARVRHHRSPCKGFGGVCQSRQENHQPGGETWLSHTLPE